MNSRTEFHLDCSDVIPECGCECGKCIQEMESIFAETHGVSKFYREGDGVVVEHDPAIVAAEQLMNIFKTLPSFYPGNFIPSIIKT